MDSKCNHGWSNQSPTQPVAAAAAGAFAPAATVADAPGVPASATAATIVCGSGQARYCNATSAAAHLLATTNLQ